MTSPNMHASDFQSQSGLLFADCWLHRRQIVRLVLVAALLTAGGLYLIPKEWTATGSFVVQESGGDQMQGLSGITAKFGIDLSSSTSGYSPRFFAALLVSHEVLETVADLKLPAGTENAGKTVTELLGRKGQTPAIRKERTIAYLKSNVVSPVFDQRTGITSYAIKTNSAELSAAIADALVAELNRFAAERHQSRASAERKFLEARMAVVVKELTAAEDALVKFMMENRSYQQSPQGSVEFSRLSRKVSEMQGVQSMLSQTFEQARIEEVRDSPVLSTVDRPEIPVLSDKRSLSEWLVGVALLVLLIAIGGLSASRLLGLSPPWPANEPSSFKECWPSIKHDLVRPWRFIL